MNSPVAIASAVFEAATMPPFSARCSTRIRGSRAAHSSSRSRTRAEGERSSTRQSSQSPKVCARTDSIVDQRTALGVS